MKKAKIAVIMKKNQMRNNIVIKLQMAGHRVYIAPEGKELFKVLEKMTLDLILLGDTEKKSHLEYMDQLKMEKAIVKIPVIAIITKSVGNSDMVKILQKGAIDLVYIKDNNVEQVLNVVNEFVGGSSEKFSTKIEEIGDNMIIKLSGSIDRTNSFNTRKNFDKVIEENVKNIIVDLSELSYIESVGLGLLIYMQKRSKAKNLEIKFVVKSEKIKKLFTMVKLDKYFDIYNSLEELVVLPEKKKKIKVVIIDDTKFMRKLMGDVLRKEGFEIQEFESPIIALEELKNLSPDMILVDYEMPDMNGIEFIQEFKPDLKEIPTVMITTLKDMDLALKAIRLGASDFLNKPFEREELIHTIRKIVRENELKKENERLFLEIKQREKELNRKNTQLKALYSELEEELQMASEIQGKLLPQEFPNIADYNFAVKYQPSQDIGGDFYDFIEMPNGFWGIAFADISGHGIPASLLSTMFKVYLVAYAKDIDSPGEVMEIINELVAESFPEGKFISLFYMILDQKNDKIKYCKASQEPGILIKNDGTIEELITRGQVLGLFSAEDFPEMVVFEEKEILLEKGDKIFLYTDGIIEAQNKQEEFFGLEKLKNILKDNAKMSPSELIDTAFGELLDFLEGLPISDDLTMLALEKG